MKRPTAKLLLDAAQACQETIDFTTGVSREEYLESRGLNLILTKLIENIGEALRQAEATDPPLVRQITDLRKIIGTRNRITHLYYQVDYELLWDILQQEIPKLQQELAELMASAPALREHNDIDAEDT